MKKAIWLLGLSLLAGTALAADEMPANDVPVSQEPFRRTLRSVSIEDLVTRKLDGSGNYSGSDRVKKYHEQYEAAFYNTLALEKVYREGVPRLDWRVPRDGTNRPNKEQGKWTYAPIPQYTPPPCDQPQPTGYDAEGCRYVNSLFKEVEQKDPAKAKAFREQVRRGRDVWAKGTFGNQDYYLVHFGRDLIGEPIDYTAWLDTRNRKDRFRKFGLINDPDCKEGSEKTYWLDECKDPHSAGVVGFRKYFAPKTDDFDPRTSAYQEGELAQQKRFVIGHSCATCHVAFDPTNPPADPTEPKWENLDFAIGNQYTINPLIFIQGLPKDHPGHHLIGSFAPGAVDTSQSPNDFIHNPGTINNITDTANRPVFEHKIKDPMTGEVKVGRTRHVLKGGEDSVGEVLALLRVYINIGMCSEECWTPHFPIPGALVGEKARQTPFRVKECSQDCEAWNYAEAKMIDLAAFLITAGPFYLEEAVDVDQTAGKKYIDYSQVPAGRKVYAENCARCHSTKVAPDVIKNDKVKLADFYKGHVFGREESWQHEFTEEERNSEEFQKKYLVDGRPKQFAEKGVFGQDWLGNDQLTPYNEIGINRCRAMHTNHKAGHIWEDFASETYRAHASPGSESATVNQLLPIPWEKSKLGAKEQIKDGPGYYRNVSLLSIWSHAPFLHNNAIGNLKYLPDGSIDYTVKGRIEMFEDAMAQLLMSDKPEDKPHREPKIARVSDEIKVTNQEDGKGPLTMTVKKGTPVGYFASINPHDPLYMTCGDLVENKGHQFGVDLKPEQKKALIEFLKTL